MEGLKNQTNNLKLNVSSINSYLINSNKQLKTLKLKNRNFARREVQKQSRIQRERKLESPLKGITGVFSNIASKAKTPFRSIFDKLFEFFTIIATGVIIDKLPQIISAVSDFFKNNKWIFDGLSFVFNAIGNGINGVINLVNFLTQPKKKEIEKNLNDIDKQFDNINRELDVDLSNLPSEPISEGDEQTTRRADDPNVMPDGSVIRIGDTVGGPDFAPPEPTKIQPLKKYARGGLVSGNKSTDVSGRLAEKQALKRSDYFTRYANTIKSNNTTFKLTKENREKFGDTVDSIIKFEKNLMNQKGSTTTSTSTTTSQTAAKVTGGTLPSNATITSYAGLRMHPITKKMKHHNGVDVSAGAGTPVSSAQNAEVLWSGYKDDGYGYSVVLRHDDGAETRYGHLQSVSVQTGKKIKAGQLLGIEGSTGMSTGPHVHFEHYPNGGAMKYSKDYANPKPSAIMDNYFRFGGNVAPISNGQGGPDLMPVQLNRSIEEDIYSESGTIALQRVYIIKNNTIPMPIPLA